METENYTTAVETEQPRGRRGRRVPLAEEPPRPRFVDETKITPVKPPPSDIYPTEPTPAEHACGHIETVEVYKLQQAGGPPFARRWEQLERIKEKAFCKQCAAGTEQIARIVEKVLAEHKHDLAHVPDPPPVQQPGPETLYGRALAAGTGERVIGTRTPSAEAGNDPSRAVDPQDL